MKSYFVVEVCHSDVKTTTVEGGFDVEDPQRLLPSSKACVFLRDERNLTEPWISVNTLNVEQIALGCEGAIDTKCKHLS